METPQETFNENLLEALIWNLQMPLEISDDGADHNIRVAKDKLKKTLAAHDAAIRTECAERALVYYCQEVCIEDGEKENAICRRRGGCRWANKLRAAIMGE